MTLLAGDLLHASPALGTLVSNLCAAVDTLHRVDAQLDDHELARAQVGEAIPRLESMIDELELLEDATSSQRPVPHSWTLDRSWYDTAFAVASARPRVLLTLAANALAALIGLYTHALDEVMPHEVESVFLRHRESIAEIKDGFTELRGWSLLQSA